MLFIVMINYHEFSYSDALKLVFKECLKTRTGPRTNIPGY